jgi:hypothetical protein
LEWQEVRKLYPNQFVLVKILKSHMEDNKRYVDDVAIIRPIDDAKKATRLLVRAERDELVYHTGNKEIVAEVRQLKSYRGLI